MSENPGSVVSRARYRVRAYHQLLLWLFGIAARNFKGAIALSIIATITSIVFEGLALAMVIGAVEQLQESGQLVQFPGIDRLGIIYAAPTVPVLILVFVLVYSAGSTLTFLGRRFAIRLESDMYRHFYYSIGSFFTRKTESDPKLLKILWARRLLAKRSALLRILSGDARFGGVIARLGLYNVTHLGNIAVGLFIVALFAPVLLPSIVAFAALAAVVMYPINLRATRDTRRLEVEAARRSKMIREKIGFLIGTQARLAEQYFDEEIGSENPEEDGPDEAAGSEQEIVDGYLSVLESRLQILESSRAVMSTLVGAGIGALVGFMFSGGFEGMVSYSALLVLFFGLRFMLNGIQGAMVTITSINRYLPNLIRLNELVLSLEALDERSSERELEGTRPIESSNGDSEATPDRPPVTSAQWRIETRNLQAIEGQFNPGTVFGLMTPSIPIRDTVNLIRGISQPGVNTPVLVDDHYLAGCGQEKLQELDNRSVNQTGEWDSWVFADSDSPQTHDYLAACILCSRESPAVAILDATRLFHLSNKRIAALAACFTNTTVLIHSDSIVELRQKCPARYLFIANDARVLCLVDGITVNANGREFINEACTGDWRHARVNYEMKASDRIKPKQ